MQFSSFALVAMMASFTYAQSIESELAKLPACGLACITSASQSVGCTPYDFACQCGSKREALTQAAIPCVTRSCQPSDLATITTVSTEICRLATLQNMSGSSSVSGTRAPTGSSTQRPASATSSAAAVTNTPNAASNSRFGAAGAAVGVGAIVAAIAL